MFVLLGKQMVRVRIKLNAAGSILLYRRARVERQPHLQPTPRKAEEKEARARARAEVKEFVISILLAPALAAPHARSITSDLALPLLHRLEVKHQQLEPWHRRRWRRLRRILHQLRSLEEAGLELVEVLLEKPPLFCWRLQLSLKVPMAP